MPHTIRPDDCDVVVFSRVLNPHPSDFFSNKIDQLIANLQPIYEICWERFAESKEQSPKSTANIDDFDLLFVMRLNRIV